MNETLLEHYVLGGGWAMLVLVPGLLVALATIIRGGLMLRRDNLVGRDSSSETIVARLADVQVRFGAITPEDIRAEVYAESLRIFSFFQALQVVFVLAPIMGLLGSITAIMASHTAAAGTGNLPHLASEMERALIPSFWGLGVSGLSYAGFAWLRLRLFRLEQSLIRPTVESMVSNLNKNAVLPLRRGD